MTKYSPQIQRVLALLMRKGTQVIIRRETVIAPDSEPWKGGSVNYTDYVAPVIFFPYTRIGHEWLGYDKGVEVPDGQTLAVFPALPFDLTMQHFVINGIVGTEEVLRFSSINPLQPDGAVILYATILHR